MAVEPSPYRYREDCAGQHAGGEGAGHRGDGGVQVGGEWGEEDREGVVEVPYPMVWRDRQRGDDAAAAPGTGVPADVIAGGDGGAGAHPQQPPPLPETLIRDSSARGSVEVSAAASN